MLNPGLTMIPLLHTFPLRYYFNILTNVFVIFIYLMNLEYITGKINYTVSCLYFIITIVAKNNQMLQRRFKPQTIDRFVEYGC